MRVTSTTTVAEAKAWLRDRCNGGAKCPVCDRLVKVYRRKLHSGMARVLVELVRIALQKGPEVEPGGWFHVVEVCKARGLNAMSMEYSKLRHWGFIEPKPGNDDPHKRTSGYWRVTAKAHDFVAGRISVPAHIWVYDQRLIRCDDENTTIESALGNKWSWRELMDG